MAFGSQRIATVSLNPAFDKTVTVHRLVAGKTNRVEVERVDAGGKGVNVSKALIRLGIPVIALGFEAGANGRFILDALRSDGIATDFIHVPGETRVNLKIRDLEMGTETELNEAGFKVQAEHLEELRLRLKTHATTTSLTIFAGSLPPNLPVETFRELMRVASAEGQPCILDTAGPAMKLGLEARPLLIKPNRAEVEELLQTEFKSRKELARAGRELIDMGAAKVLISLGAEGAIGVTPNEALFAHPPKVTVRSTVGAGDTMVAVMAKAEIEGMAFRDAFQMAVAASAATVAMEGARVADLAAIHGLISKVNLENVE